MKNSLMYKMSYYNYNSLFPAGQAQDRVRGSKLPAVGPELSTVEEAFTSENWIIRIYKVKKPDNLGRTLQEATAFEKGNKRKKAGKRKGARVLRVDSSKTWAKMAPTRLSLKAVVSSLAQAERQRPTSKA